MTNTNRVDIVPQRVVGFLGTIILAGWACYQAAWHMPEIKDAFGDSDLLLIALIIIGGIVFLVKWPWSEQSRTWTVVGLLAASILFGGDKVKEVFGDAPWVALAIPVALWVLWELTVLGRWPWDAFQRRQQRAPEGSATQQRPRPTPPGHPERPASIDEMLGDRPRSSS